MSPAITRGPAAATLPPVAGPVLESLYQHRVLSTGQLHAMHTPAAGHRWMQQVLADLTTAGLLAYVRAGQGGAAALPPHPVPCQNPRMRDQC